VSALKGKRLAHLKSELDGLLRYIQRVRVEITSIDRPADEENGFGGMGDQLDAIVQATEKATNTIMNAMEQNDDAVAKLREGITDPDQLALLDKITNSSNDVFEACSFQDITGQRVNKVVKSITYVEERVNALVDIWGKDELDKVDVTGKEKTEDEKLLDCPQLEGGAGLSQDDIDALFD
jgi:chemotaxis protein CheZ